MKRLSGPRKTINLSESIHQRLSMCAIAAGAAGVSLLALARPTEAKIVYTPANVKIGPNQGYYLDLNNDGIPDFGINHFFHNGNCSTVSALSEGALNRGGGAEGKPPAALGPGKRVGPSQHFCGSGGYMVRYNRHFFQGRCIQGTVGNWRAATNKYLGLAFRTRCGPWRHG